MIDDIVLRVQAIVDRFARWARLGARADPERRRFLIVQIDGLSAAILDKALAAGRVRHLARWLRSGRLERQPMSVGLPTSTPAFQAAAMYGVRPDIPGFHYYDKRAGLELHFPRPGAADFVERRHAEGRRGILEGGACYGCVFTGGAEESLLTFARLLRPTRAGLTLLRLPLSIVLLGWVVAKCLVLTGVELSRFVLRVAAKPRLAGAAGLRWLGLKIVFSVWMRELFTLAVSAAIYRGVPAIYVNYLDYDVFAHAFGPGHRSAMRALKHIDASIGQLDRILGRLPDLGYDLYILSDHGQTLTRHFPDVSGGLSLEEVVRDILRGSEGTPGGPARDGSGRRIGVARQIAGFCRAKERGLLQRFGNHVEREVAVSPREIDHTLDAVRVITAGPNGFVYLVDSVDPVTLEELDRRFPGAAARLSKHPGIGLVLARSAGGPVCWWRGRRIAIDGDGRDGPFAERPDHELVRAGLQDLIAMPSAGDLVVYGIGAPGEDVSFIEERGAHAGPSPAEMQTFVLHSAGLRLPTPLTHPMLLYGHFAAYRGRNPDQRETRTAGDRTQ